MHLLFKIFDVESKCFYTDVIFYMNLNDHEFRFEWIPAYFKVKCLDEPNGTSIKLQYDTHGVKRIIMWLHEQA